MSNPIRHFLAFFFLLIDKSYVLIINTLREITGWGLGLPHGDFGDFEIPVSIFFTCLLVSPTYWESVTYKKSQDGDYGDLSNPIQHFLHFSFLLAGKYYILSINTL